MRASSNRNKQRGGRFFPGLSGRSTYPAGRDVGCGGANCPFAPGVYDWETIAKLVKAVEAPVNILANAACPPMAELEKIGVARVSAGSGIMRAAMAAVRWIGKEMLQAPSCEALFAGA